MTSRLLIMNGSSQGSSLLLDGNKTLIIGRNFDCGLRFQDALLSNYHCCIYGIDDSFCLEDMNSTNGTKVNDQSIHDPYLLRSQDIISLGNINLCFIEEEQQEEQKQATEIKKNIREKEQNAACFREVGDYYILKKLGDGASGEIFKAKHTNSGKLFALKIFHPYYCMDEISMQRFVQEAKVCMKFNHPRIVKVFDFAIFYNRPVIVMEYLKGISLAQYISKRGTLMPQKALRIALYIAQGIHYAHKMGVIHRDINPSNIFMGRGFQVKVIDFGIVKVYGESITLGAQTLGTMNYIPPEQIDNAKEVDFKADVYGLGATLYHTLLGKPPYFDIHGIHSLTLRITGTPAQPLKSLMEIPSYISDLVEKAMHPDKKKRFCSMEDFFYAIQNTLKRLSLEKETTK
ncbi:MAG: protein kinase [Candidatus Brocadiae bacterium]|nr:protein kinase [Candidatus Brocadiia bacterium]